MNVTETQTSTSALVANGGAATVLSIILRDTLYNMLPYILICLFIIVMDLYYGVKAAKLRGEDVRVSRAARRTLAKVFEYICWIVVGAGLTVAFRVDWLDNAIIGTAMAIESISLISNALYCKGYKVSGIEDTIIKKIGQKHDIDTSDIKIHKTKKKK